MKKNISKFLLLLVTCLNLYGSEYKWSVYASKSEAYVNEAIYLKYVCEFSDRAELYNVEFNPVTHNDTYTIEPLSQNIKLVDGKKINTYEYVAFIKKPMLMDFSFDLLMKKTTKASIENTVLGRDNIDYEEFAVTPIKTKSIEVLIKETSSDIYGNLSIEIKKDEGQLKAYEPFHLDITISGKGNFHAIENIEFNIDDVKVFAQKPIEKIKLTKDGYKGSWSQKFAFIGRKNFLISSKSIEYFDENSQSLKKLQVDAIDVKVEEVYKQSELLDEVGENFTYDPKYLYYFLTFIAGFLLAKIKFKTKAKDTKNTQLRDKIQNTKSINELSMLLILNNQRKFHDILTAIDTNELSSLTEAKSKVMKLIVD